MKNKEKVRAVAHGCTHAEKECSIYRCSKAIVSCHSDHIEYS